MTNKTTLTEIRAACERNEPGYAAYLLSVYEGDLLSAQIKEEDKRFQDFAIGLATGVVITALVLGMVFL